MAQQAYNFATRVSNFWNKGRDISAIEIAIADGAQKIRAMKHPGFINVEGDIPCSLWRWPDGSEYVIQDDGNGIVRKGRCEEIC